MSVGSNSVSYRLMQGGSMSDLGYPLAGQMPSSRFTLPFSPPESCPYILAYFGCLQHSFAAYGRMWPFSDTYPEVKLGGTYDTYDYIVVGGGTAGCVLANRLSADPTKTVLLVERGPRADTWVSRVPLLSSDFSSDGTAALRCESTFQTELGRSIQLVTGGLLGGTSRINSMVYLRGRPAEYDAWAAAGRKGWAWKDLRPYFLKSEDSKAFGRVEDVHSVGGEWQVRRFPKIYFQSSWEALQACIRLGLPNIRDMNCPAPPTFGCGELTYTIDQSGCRHSTYRAFLPAHLTRARSKNLHICTETLAEKLLIKREPNEQRVVQGVRLISKRGGVPFVKTVNVKREVILAGGPFGSPQILMLSGVGPAEHLKEHNIEVVKDLPAVGSNLEDHINSGIDWKVPLHDSLVSLQINRLTLLIEFIRYLIWGVGLLLAPVVQMAIFIHSSVLDNSGRVVKEKLSTEALPDMQIYPCAISSGCPLPQNEGVFSFYNVLLRPKSRGTVRLTSTDPFAPLTIDPGFLTDPEDKKVFRASFKFCLRLCEQMRAQGYKMVDHKVPRSESDEDLDEFLRQGGTTSFHYCSTCRMAPENDPKGGGVVDDELRVHGVSNLRVADSSIFPWIVAINTQAVTVVVGEKCADMVLSQAKSL